MKIRTVVMWSSLVAAGLQSASAAPQPVDYPTRTVEVIVPYAISGGVGAMARAFATEASKETMQPWIVTTREGAGGVVGFNFLARAAPDGYTVVFSPASPLTNALFVQASIPFKSSQILPICQIFENVFAVAVAQNSPLRSFADLLEKAKAAPGAVSYGHAGPASVAHLSMAAVENTLKVKFNPIAYRGDGPLLTDAMGGTIDFAAPAISSLAGKNLRVLAVLSDKRHPAYPAVPAIAEFGVSAVTPGLNGIYVPQGTPKSVIARLERICENVTNSAAFKENAKTFQQLPKYLDAETFQVRIDRTYQSNARLVPDLKLEKN